MRPRQRRRFRGPLSRCYPPRGARAPDGKVRHGQVGALGERSRPGSGALVGLPIKSTPRRRALPMRRRRPVLACLLLACRGTPAPTPAATCTDWASSGECTRNPSFMWVECVDACKSLGLHEPWAELDELARSGPDADARILELSFPPSSGYAALSIALRADLSPKTVAAVVAAVDQAASQQGPAATFYRNEARPTAPPVQCGEILCGPYALIQGRLVGLKGTPAEGQPIVRRGYVARIKDGADFFIALDDHTEWGHSFTVWGELVGEAGMRTLEAIARLPYREQAGAGGTIMRLLDEELPATGRLVTRAATSNGAVNSTSSTERESTGTVPGGELPDASGSDAASTLSVEL